MPRTGGLPALRDLFPRSGALLVSEINIVDNNTPYAQIPIQGLCVIGSDVPDNEIWSEYGLFVSRFANTDYIFFSMNIVPSHLETIVNALIDLYS